METAGGNRRVKAPKAPMTKTAKGAFRRGTAGLRRFQFIEPIASPKTLLIVVGKVDRDVGEISRTGNAHENNTDSRNGSTNAINTNIQTPVTKATTTAHRICSRAYLSASLKLVVGM